MRYILDTFIWEEFFRPRRTLSVDVQSLIGTSHSSSLITPEIVLLELAQLYGNSNIKFDAFVNDKETILKASTYTKTTFEQVHEAGTLRRLLSPKIGLRSGNKIGWIDCTVLAIALGNCKSRTDAKVLTGDPHFWEVANPHLCGLTEFINEVSREVGYYLPSTVEYVGEAISVEGK